MNKTTRCSSIRESDFTLGTFQLNQIPGSFYLTISNLSYLKGYQIVDSVPLSRKFVGLENLLGVLMQYENLGFCEFGLNQRRHQL